MAAFFSVLNKILIGILALVGIHLAAVQPQTPNAPQPSASLVKATTTGTTKVVPKINKKTTGVAPAAAPTSTQPAAPQQRTAQPEPSISPDALLAEADGAVVNIFCTAGGNTFDPISGSGVIIDPRGVILTNAHVGQFFLLRDYPVPDNIQCTVRTGSPAKSAYTAKLLYLPERWVDDNASILRDSTPSGTGENDYSFLLITGSANQDAPLPSSFPFVEPSKTTPRTGDLMLLSAYPAGFSGGILISTSLYHSSSYASVAKLYIFHDTDSWVDLFSVPGTVVSQSGASGGAVLNRQDGTLAGIITTDTNATTTAGRDLEAITMSHIDHSLFQDGLNSIASLLSGNLTVAADQFNSTLAPQELQTLRQALEK